MNKSLIVEIWTWSYMPFTIGGEVCRPIKAEVVAESLHDIGGGYQGYLVKTPKGNTRVAEAETGAIIGDSIKQVKADISKGAPEVMAQQIEKSKEDAARAELIDADDFWSRMKENR